MSTHEELKAMVDKTFSVHLLPFVATNAPLRELVQYIDDQTEIVIVALLREIDQPTSMEFTGECRLDGCSRSSARRTGCNSITIRAASCSPKRWRPSRRSRWRLSATYRLGAAGRLHGGSRTQLARLSGPGRLPLGGLDQLPSTALLNICDLLE